MEIQTNYKQVESVFKQWQKGIFSTIEECEEYFLVEFSERWPDINTYTDKNGEERQIQPIDHYPELKEYEVWKEGYNVPGSNDEVLPSFLGSVKARNFTQACHIIVCTKFLDLTQSENEYGHKEKYEVFDYSPNTLAYERRKLYWSEETARKNLYKILI